MMPWHVAGELLTGVNFLAQWSSPYVVIDQTKSVTDRFFEAHPYEANRNSPRLKEEIRIGVPTESTLQLYPGQQLSVEGCCAMSYTSGLSNGC
jgi:hypothetical protein